MKQPFFDIGKIKPGGYHYLGISFTLPYHLHLPDDNYEADLEINLPNQKGLLRVQILLYEVTQNENISSSINKPATIELIDDIKTSFKQTTATVCIPIGSKDPNKPSDIEAIWEQVSQTKTWYLHIAIQSVNHLLETYRYHSKEYHVKLLTGHELRFNYYQLLLFNEEPAHAKKSNFSVRIRPIFNWQDIYPQKTTLPNDVTSNIRSDLTNQTNPSLSENLLLNAYNYFDQGDYRLAVIEVETAFEAAIHQHLHNYFSGQLEILAEVERKNRNFTNLIKDSFCRPAFNGKKFHENTSEYQRWREGVMDLRNDLVHAKKESVTKLETLHAIETIEQTLAFLISRQITIPPKLYLT